MIFSSVQFGLGVLLFFCGTFFLSAQKSGSRVITLNLNEVALLDIESTGTAIIPFNFSAPSEAGLPLTNPIADTQKWLNYTSAVKAGVFRSISAQISESFSGLSVQLQTYPATGNGGGALGTPVDKVTLTNTPTTIISGIGGAFTGNGVNNGHLLKIYLTVNDYKKLVQTTNKVITITYTISN